MKILKRILIGLVIFIALLLIVALFVKKEFATEREITINRPKQEVFDYIKYLKNQDNYGVWQQMDPGMKKTYQGTDGTVGFVYAWDGKKMGKGEQENVNIIDGERVDSKLRFKTPWESEADTYMTTEASGESQTTVTWSLSGEMPYPFNLMSLVSDMGNDLGDGLENLKVILEK